jgi:hypothetical protein
MEAGEKNDFLFLFLKVSCLAEAYLEKRFYKGDSNNLGVGDPRSCWYHVEEEGKLFCLQINEKW